MKKEELRLKEVVPKKYRVQVPKRLRSNLKESTAFIEYLDGEYQYTPKLSTWLTGERLTSDELIAIAKKLDELNKNK